MNLPGLFRLVPRPGGDFTVIAELRSTALPAITVCAFPRRGYRIATPTLAPASLAEITARKYTGSSLLADPTLRTQALSYRSISTPRASDRYAMTFAHNNGNYRTRIRRNNSTG